VGWYNGSGRIHRERLETMERSKSVGRYRGLLTVDGHGSPGSSRVQGCLRCDACGSVCDIPPKALAAKSRSGTRTRLIVDFLAWHVRPLGGQEKVFASLQWKRHGHLEETRAEMTDSRRGDRERVGLQSSDVIIQMLVMQYGSTPLFLDLYCDRTMRLTQFVSNVLSQTLTASMG
jgi:hypothetical protein